MSALLELHGVSRTFGSGPTAVVALHHTDLSIATGELVALMGPSGSGKSTLLTIAGGLDLPNAGRVVIDGTDITALDTRRRAGVRRGKVGFVFQDLNLLDALTAAENVAMPLELGGMAARPARQQAIIELERVGIADKADRFPDDLSGGERQRVAIARATVGACRLLLADEPTGALDSVNGEAIMRILRSSCDAGAAGLMVTHDAQLAAWADRVVFIRDGRVSDQTQPGGPESIANPTGMAR